MTHRGFDALNALFLNVFAFKRINVDEVLRNRLDLLQKEIRHHFEVRTHSEHDADEHHTDQHSERMVGNDDERSCCRNIFQLFGIGLDDYLKVIESSI